MKDTKYTNKELVEIYKNLKTSAKILGFASASDCEMMVAIELEAVKRHLNLIDGTVEETAERQTAEQETVEGISKMETTKGTEDIINRKVIKNMKIVYFERPYARGWETMDKIPMVVEDTYPHDGIVDKKTLLNDYYDNKVLYYPDITRQWGTGYEMERRCREFMKVAEETNCTFKVVKAQLEYFCYKWHRVVTATEINSEVFKKIKSSYAPFYALEDKDHFYKIGDKLYYRTYVQQNGEDWGCGNDWKIYTPEKWIE